MRGLSSQTKWLNAMSCLEHLFGSVSIRNLCLRAPVNPWPSPMQIRLKWAPRGPVWSVRAAHWMELLLDVIHTVCLHLKRASLLCFQQNMFPFSSYFLHSAQVVFHILMINISLLKHALPGSLTFHLLISFHAQMWSQGQMTILQMPESKNSQELQLSRCVAWILSICICIKGEPHAGQCSRPTGQATTEHSCR